MTFITALLWAEKQRWWKFEDRDEVNNPLETDPKLVLSSLAPCSLLNLEGGTWPKPCPLTLVCSTILHLICPHIRSYWSPNFVKLEFVAPDFSVPWSGLGIPEYLKPAAKYFLGVSLEWAYEHRPDSTCISHWHKEMAGLRPTMTEGVFHQSFKTSAFYPAKEIQWQVCWW